MKLKFIYALTISFCLSSNSAATPQSAHPSYSLENTEVRDIPAPALNRDYQLYVALPDSYVKGNQRYPVVFVVDANYGFPIVRSVAQRLHKHAGMEEIIVVGLSYAKSDAAVYSRRRDYTPTVPRNHSWRSDMPERQPAFGEAAAYGKFVYDDVFAFVAREYRADMRRKIFVGHSYGSLLGLQVLFTKPHAFEHYILSSPSLWYDAGIMFDQEKAYTEKHNDLPASVFFGIGGLERLASGKRRSRTEKNADMVEDLREFEHKLRSHRYPSLITRLRIFEDEDHASVFPSVLTHGLRTYLKSAR